MRLLDALALAASGVGAGAMNALAGGGTILTFPALLWLGESAKVANATSTVALLPGAGASLFAYRREVTTHREWLTTLFAPSLAGGAAGALLLRATPEELFGRLAPWLVLFATALFAAQSWRARRGGATPQPALEGSPRRSHAVLAHFAVAVYGGYFGAGIGILMLVILGYLGLSDIHAMNGLKNFFGLCINGVAAAIFLASGLVDLPSALVLLVGSIVGGYGGARFGRWIGPNGARAAVVVIGTFVGLVLLIRGI